MGKFRQRLGGTLLLSVFLSFQYQPLAQGSQGSPEAAPGRVFLNHGCAELVRSFVKLTHPPLESLGPQLAAQEATMLAAAPPTPHPDDPVEMDLADVQIALDGLDKLYEAVWGKNYLRESLHGNLDALGKEVRSVLSLYQLAGERRVPREVLLGIEERYQRQNDRIEALKGRIARLRKKLGPSVEYLTPATLAALDIFKEIGRSRNLIGGGVREAFRTTARTVKTNLDSMMVGVSCAGVFDSALKDLLVFVAQLVDQGKLDPRKDPRMRRACEDLIIANFMVAASSIIPPADLSAETLSTFKAFGSESDSQLEGADLNNFNLLVNRVYEWQGRLQTHVGNFVRTYYRGRIAWNTLSIMTRPNGYRGVPLGSALRAATASLSDHPDTLRLTLRAYGDRQHYLSLSIGDLIESPMGPREMLEERNMAGVERVLTPFLTTDARLGGLFSMGYEHELREAEQLLRMSQRSRFWGFLSWGTGQVAGGIARNFFNHADLVQQIAPGKFIDALVLQLEGTGSDPKAVANKPEHRRKPEVLPRNLPTYLVDGAWVTPWNRRARIIAPPNVKALEPRHEAEEDDFEPIDVFEDSDDEVVEKAPSKAEVPVDDNGDIIISDSSDETPVDDELPITPVQKKRSSKRDRYKQRQESRRKKHRNPSADADSPALAANGEVDNYFWAILDKLENRARQLLETDSRIQSDVERGTDANNGQPWGRVSQQEIHQLSQKVEQLLNVTLKVLAAVESSFRADTVRTENAEETFAWHLLKRAPTLAMYTVIGPPGAPNLNPPVVPGLAGLSWRIIMLAPRLAYGDGSVEEAVFLGDGGVEDPENALSRYRTQIATAILGAVVAVGGTKAVQVALHALGAKPPAATTTREITKDQTPPHPAVEKAKEDVDPEP
jgi:hypothetical protein